MMEVINTNIQDYCINQKLISKNSFREAFDTLEILLFTATCPEVKVLHTKHSSGDNGRYFFFSNDEMSKLVGDDNWNAQKLEIVQYGSHSWRGKVIVWRVTSGSHGRKLDGDANGDWKKDDTIMLQTCSKEGKF